MSTGELDRFMMTELQGEEAESAYNTSNIDFNLPLDESFDCGISLDDFYEPAIHNDSNVDSEIFTNTNLDPRLVQPSYSIVNTRLGVRFGDGFDVSVFANNIFNEAVILQDAVTTLFGKDPSYQRFLNQPRELGVTVRKEF